MIKPWSREEREDLRLNVPKLGLDAPHDRSNVYDVAAQAVGIAEAGLVRRNRLNAQGRDESIHMAPLEETIRLAKTPAERWIVKFRNEWHGDMTKVFKEAEM